MTRLARLRRALRAVDSPTEALLAVRMLGWAVVLPVLTRTVPLQRLVSLLARRPPIAPTDPARAEAVGQLARRVHRAANLGLRDNCLERSLLAYRYVSAHAAPELVLGARAGDNGVEGHAWVVVDGEALHDHAEDVARYVRVSAFGADGRILSSPTAPGR